MRAVFKADGAETEDRYSVSEWWMEPRNSGPGAHHHEQVKLYYRRIGNLALLRASENANLKSIDFGAKKAVYATSPYVLTQQIAAAQEWRFDELLRGNGCSASLH
jgi:hypothetical protein